MEILQLLYKLAKALKIHRGIYTFSSRDTFSLARDAYVKPIFRMNCIILSIFIFVSGMYLIFFGFRDIPDNNCVSQPRIFTSITFHKGFTQVMNFTRVRKSILRA